MKVAGAMLTICPADSFDIPVLAALHETCFTAPWDQHWTQQSFKDVLGMPGAGAFIAAIGSDPVGFAVARVAADEAELLLIGTRPDYRRSGHGRALLERLLETLKRGGAVRVLLEVAEPNVPALRFYHQLGFREVGRRPDYFRGDSTADAMVLARPLGDAAAPKASQ
jgi:[ribosomal protein S18]-alanine N-acetyltransferase